MLAIVSAMPEEIALVVDALARVETRELGRRVFHAGTFHGVEAVAVFSRMGKVAAAATITQLIASYPVSRLLFSGVAGGVRRGLAIGDIIVASALIQHDMDASPIFPRYEVPLLGQARFETDADTRERLLAAAHGFLAHDLRTYVAGRELEFFDVSSPQASLGVVASGDKFFASALEVEELRGRLPETACVEMEGAAAAQVCAEYGIPFGVVRTISDSADENSVHDFPRFAREIARHYSAGTLERFARAL
ncbi:MAG: 5'-methylthioadenosine/adenosylhomocysteine nucleosidase [Steroidobacteraceae bacterium]